MDFDFGCLRKYERARLSPKLTCHYFGVAYLKHSLEGSSRDQLWYLIVSIPDLCTLTYFHENPKDEINFLIAFLPLSFAHIIYLEMYLCEFRDKLERQLFIMPIMKVVAVIAIAS